MMRALFFFGLLVWSGFCWAQNALGRAHMGGPELNDPERLSQVEPHQVLAQMFRAIEATWFSSHYRQAKQLEMNAKIDATLPPVQLRQKLEQSEPLSVNFDLEANFAPNGRHHLAIEGDFGEMTFINDLHRDFMSSRQFKSFSDSPLPGRAPNANLNNYYSFIMREFSPMREKILNSGVYRIVYGGSGNYRGRLIHNIRVYKPLSRQNLENRKRLASQPISLKKLWTFWHEGGYEIWVYRDNALPAAIFYSNSEQNIYANLIFDYDSNHLPARISFNNNSVGAEGSGAFIFTFDDQGMLSGGQFRFESDHGISIQLNATLNFLKEEQPDIFRIIPAFGFKKVNKDVLKLMLLTQISGNILKLKQYGLNIKNFTFGTTSGKRR